MLKCEQCGKKITSSKDVNVLAKFGIVPTTFCNNCYAAKERSYMRHFIYLPKQPINSTPFKVSLFFYTVLLLGLTIFAIIKLGNYLAFYFWIPVMALSVIVLWEWRLWLEARRRVKEAEKK